MLTAKVKDLPPAIQWGAIAAVLGFVISLSSTSSSSSNGITTSCNHFDIAAVVFGLVAIGCGAVGITKLQTLESKGLPGGLIAAAIVLGVVHLLRGFGVILAPC